MTPTNVIVQSDGSVVWVPPVNYRVRCEHAWDNELTNCTLKSVIPQRLKVLSFDKTLNAIFTQ